LIKAPCRALTRYSPEAIICHIRYYEVGTLAVDGWYSEEETGRDPSPPRPLLAVPNVTAHPLMASVPITVLLYFGPLLCDLNVSIKEPTRHHHSVCVTVSAVKFVCANTNLLTYLLTYLKG